ncbi:MAG TPA: serine hydrolase domain-containing protein [Bacteroidales bacterium]|nr:serine hydrolase domain-containing protein [Bacteroidales bacterium]
MHELIVKITVLLIIVSCSQQRNKSSIEQRIYRIENGLIEFKSPAGMFQPDSEQLADPKILTERMEHYKTPGLSIAVINDNQIEWTKAYGTININTGVPVTTGTIFEAASTSKFITAVLALHFVQKGLIDLDINVNNYLKSWKVPENEFTQEEKVTLRRLLTHQAGLPATNYDYDENVGIPTLLDVLSGESPALNKPAIPELVPGSQWQYSNVAYDLIQLLLEDVTGKSFQQIAEEIIFEPLGMNNSTFVYPLDSEKKKREAMPHDGEGISHEPSMSLTALAHAGLTTTPTDLAIFTNEIMLSYQGKSGIIISQEMTSRLFSKEFDLDPRMFGLPLSEGLGVLLMGEGKDLLFMHPGSNLPGLNCWLIGWPERGNSIVIMTNGAQGEVLAMEIVSAFINEYNKL